MLIKSFNIFADPTYYLSCVNIQRKEECPHAKSLQGSDVVAMVLYIQSHNSRGKTY